MTIGTRFFAQTFAATLCIGCNALPLTAGDTCGERSMELAGVSMTQGRIGVSPIRDFDLEASSVHCTPPPDRDVERYCSVEAYRARASFKQRHDWFLVSTRDKLLQRADAIWDGTYKNCMQDLAPKVAR